MANRTETTKGSDAPELPVNDVIAHLEANMMPLAAQTIRDLQHELELCRAVTTACCNNQAQRSETAPTTAPCVAVPLDLYRAVVRRLVKKRDSSTDLGLIRQLEALDPELQSERQEQGGKT